MSLSKDTLSNKGHNTVIKENQTISSGKASSAVNTKAIQRKKT
jgi:hypothetical protein